MITDIGSRLPPEASGLSATDANLDKLPPREIAQIARQYKDKSKLVTVLDENVTLRSGHLFNIYEHNKYVPKDEFGRNYFFRLGRIQIVKVFDLKSVAKIVQANKELNFQHGDIFYLDPAVEGVEGISGISVSVPGIDRLSATAPSETAYGEGVPGVADMSAAPGMAEGVMAETESGKEVSPLAPFGKKGPVYESLENRLQGERVFFAFDDSGLTESSIAALEFKATYLLEHPEASVLIEGHCDERGSVEYNLALGQRRAEAARDYLVNLGVPANRLDAVSYGKERPIDPEHTEKAWATNRRCEFRLKQ